MGFDAAQKIQGVKHRLAGLRAFKRHAAQQGGQEPPHPTITVNQLRVIVVICRPRQRFNLSTGFKQTLTGKAGIGLGANHSGSNRFVQKNTHRIPELQRRSIQVAQGPQPLFFALVAGLVDELADQEVEEVDGVIHGADLEDSRKGQQGGNSTFRGHAGDGLSSRGSAMAGQSAQTARRDVIQRQVCDAKGSHGLEALQGLNQSGSTHPYRRPSKLIQGA